MPNATIETLDEVQTADFTLDVEFDEAVFLSAKTIFNLAGIDDADVSDADF